MSAFKVDADADAAANASVCDAFNVADTDLHIHVRRGKCNHDRINT